MAIDHRVAPWGGPDKSGGQRLHNAGPHPGRAPVSRPHSARLRDDLDRRQRSGSGPAGRGFTWIDIGPASTAGVGTPGWIASDRLHPGDTQDAAWAEVIWDAVRD